MVIALIMNEINNSSDFIWILHKIKNMKKERKNFDVSSSELSPSIDGLFIKYVANVCIKKEVIKIM
jgi:hypothetical protein